MDIKHEIISNAQTGSPPVNQELEGIKGFSLQKLESACRKRGVTLEDTLAGFLALNEDDAREAKANKIHMMRDQANIALNLAKKYEPDKASVKHLGDAREPVAFVIEK